MKERAVSPSGWLLSIISPFFRLRDTRDRGQRPPFYPPVRPFRGTSSLTRATPSSGRCLSFVSCSHLPCYAENAYLRLSLKSSHRCQVARKSFICMHVKPESRICVETKLTKCRVRQQIEDKEYEKEEEMKEEKKETVASKPKIRQFVSPTTRTKSIPCS